MDILPLILIGAVASVVGIFVGITLHKKKLQVAFDEAKKDSRRVLEDAKKEADQIVTEAISETKQEAKKRRQKLEEEAKNKKREVSKLENKIKQKEQVLQKKIDIVDTKQIELQTTEQELSNQETRYKRLIGECEKTLEQSRRTLQNIANMSPSEAKRELMKSMEDEARSEAADKIKHIQESAKEEAEHKAQSMISLAVQRVSSEFVNESAVTVVSLPSDEMKGRIIGREGRNIRAIENVTGVDIIIDDTPEALILSCFNPIRREIAKTSIERLISDGRIHPARIEETVERVTDEFDQIIVEHGEQACFDTGITDLHPELIKSLGKLKYRSTSQQTVLLHSVEVATICGVMASEMGMNVKKAKKAGLLHDIGKSVGQESEGHHATIGADLIAKYDEGRDIEQAVRDHHATDVTQMTPLGVLVHAANMVSANRPGARKELLDSYVKRLSDMETFVSKVSGIDKAYVMQAGREIRAIVSAEGVEDDEIGLMAQNVADDLRKEMTFPGQIRVTVVRESQQMDFAT